MRIIGHMVTRNELHRYLPFTLGWLSKLTGGDLLVYDDQSDDGTDEYIAANGLSLAVRSDDAASFTHDESAFRAAGWAHMERILRPGPEDWILCIDADEFLVAENPDGDSTAVRSLLEEAANGADAVCFRVHEVFDRRSDGQPMIRTDAYWGEIRASRFVKWRPDGQFHPRREGGGSIPSNWPHARVLHPELALLHYGYAREADRAARHLRYSATIGHNPVHVASITRPPRLRPWTGMTPPSGA